MPFLNDHPTYLSYDDEIHHTKRIPIFFIRDVNNFIHSELMKKDEDEMVGIAYKLQHELAALGQLSAWEYGPYDHMLDGISRTLRQLEKKEFPVIMDALAIITSVLDCKDSMNEFLDENNIGYTAHIGNGEVSWSAREDIEIPGEAIEEVVQELSPNKFKNTIDHLKQAISQLDKLDNSRARKDALRDCASAVEGYVRSVTGKGKFPQAIEELVRQNKAADSFIIRDAQKVWKHIHEVLPDIRHGNNEEISTLEVAELTYFIERLMSYVKFINKIV